MSTTVFTTTLLVPILNQSNSIHTFTPYLLIVTATYHYAYNSALFEAHVYPAPWGRFLLKKVKERLGAV
jgi:hypothetical protein